MHMHVNYTKGSFHADADADGNLFSHLNARRRFGRKIVRTAGFGRRARGAREGRSAKIAHRRAQIFRRPVGRRNRRGHGHQRNYGQTSLENGKSVALRANLKKLSDLDFGF